MAKLSEKQIKELDVDWYCLVKEIPTHIASMGGLIPKQFRDRRLLRSHQDLVAKIEPFMEIKLNLDNIQSQIAEGYSYLQDLMIRNAIEVVNWNNRGFEYLRGYDLPIRLYASSFVEKARRGFRSFARKENADGNEYVLIAEPTIPVKSDLGGLGLEELECEVRNEGGTIVF